MIPSHLIGSEETVSENIQELERNERDVRTAQQVEEMALVEAQWAEQLKIQRWLLAQKLQRTWRALRVAKGMPDLQERIRTSIRGQVEELRYLSHELTRVA